MKRRSMAFVTGSKEGEGSGKTALIERLSRFVEHSDVSFYKIASRIGTSGTRLSMWLAGTAGPDTQELAAIESFLNERARSDSIERG